LERLLPVEEFQANLTGKREKEAANGSIRSKRKKKGHKVG
jgi:hypothetical protein